MLILTSLCVILLSVGTFSPSMLVLWGSPPPVTVGSQPSEADRLCKKIAEIKKLPLKRDEGGLKFFMELDPVYGEFRELGDVMVPCLFSKATDETPMDDPRQAPHYGRVAVGDVAFWVFLDITGMPLEAALPPSIRKDFENRGVEAYFDWIRKNPANRRTLQRNLKLWHVGRVKNRS